MSIVSGQYGTAKIGTTVVSEIKQWSLNKGINIYDAASAETPGTDGYQRVKGRRNHTGSMSGYWDPDGPPAFDEGDTVALKLYPIAGSYYPVSALIENVNIDVNIETGEPETWTSQFRVIGVVGDLTPDSP